MKRYLAVVILAIVALNIPQAASYTTPDRIITAYKAPSVPLIDAVEDSIWIDAIAYAVTLPDPAGAASILESSNDYAGWFKVMWDAENLYFFFGVIDDVIWSDGDEDDRIELFFDADASGGITQEEYELDYAADYGAFASWWLNQHPDHTQTYDENCSQWVMHIDGTVLSTGTQGPGLTWTGTRFPLEGIQAAVHVNSDEYGYTMEFAIPWNSLMANTPMKTGDAVGLNVQVNDIDTPGERGFYDWRSIWPNASWCDPTNFGQMTLSDMVILDPSSAIENRPNARVQEYCLAQNYPNPFNSTTQIVYNVPRLAEVNLSVYNTRGEKVATLVNEVKTAGEYKIDFSSTHLSSGIYFYKLTTGDMTLTRKMTFVK